MSFDKYFNRRYSSAEYNCAHFVCEVWHDLKGEDVANVLRGLLCTPRDRRAILSDLRRVRLLPKPCEPCMVYMQGAGPPHVGIWSRGRVLHLLNCSAVHYTPLEVATLGYNRVRFFVCQ